MRFFPTDAADRVEAVKLNVLQGAARNRLVVAEAKQRSRRVGDDPAGIALPDRQLGRVEGHLLDAEHRAAWRLSSRQEVVEHRLRLTEQTAFRAAEELHHG